MTATEGLRNASRDLEAAIRAFERAATRLIDLAAPPVDDRCAACDVPRAEHDKQPHKFLSETDAAILKARFAYDGVFGHSVFDTNQNVHLAEPEPAARHNDVLDSIQGAFTPEPKVCTQCLQRYPQCAVDDCGEPIVPVARSVPRTGFGQSGEREEHEWRHLNPEPHGRAPHIPVPKIHVT